jgi:hypothetical protein
LVLVDHRSDQGVRRDDARGAPSTTNSFKSSVATTGTSWPGLE